MRRPSSFIIAFILQYIIVTVISYVLLIFDIPFFIYMPLGLSSLMSSLFYLSVLWILFFFISRRPKLLRKILPLGHLFVWELDTINAEVEAIRTESSYSETEGFLVRRLKAINVIDERIEALRARSTFMLSSIGILLIASAIIIVFAGSLTNLDVSAASD